jgi:hypothetical protein
MLPYYTGIFSYRAPCIEIQDIEVSMMGLYMWSQYPCTMYKEAVLIDLEALNEKALFINYGALYENIPV